VIAPLSRDTLPDLAALFGVTATTRNCYCMWFIQTSGETSAGWSDGGNRAAFEALACESDLPMGLLAYRDGVPVGWVAAGPRERYGRALRSKVLAQRDATEDDRVWLVSCLFIHRDARRTGLSRDLINAAAELAREHGASAIEGFPLNAEKPRTSGDAFVGVEGMFAACGFEVVARPTPARVLMRRPLTG
jgi:GNAT superfamily N-acetyltransferase